MATTLPLSDVRLAFYLFFCVARTGDWFLLWAGTGVEVTGQDGWYEEWVERGWVIRGNGFGSDRIRSRNWCWCMESEAMGGIAKHGYE